MSGLWGGLVEAGLAGPAFLLLLHLQSWELGPGRQAAEPSGLENALNWECSAVGSRADGTVGVIALFVCGRRLHDNLLLQLGSSSLSSNSGSALHLTAILTPATAAPVSSVQPSASAANQRSPLRSDQSEAAPARCRSLGARPAPGQFKLN